jgi:ABC-2 type transport system permease protein
MTALRNSLVVMKRELKAYFEAPVAYVFMVFFLLITGFLVFAVSHFYENRVADLKYFFFWHPWVYLLLVPAATMGLWAEERRSGTIELLLTMPITMFQAIIGKFMAAWLFITLGITLTFPIVTTVCYLGDPDVGVIVCGYVGSILLAGAYVSVGMLMSSLSRSQVISFVLSLSTCLVLVLAGFDPIIGFFVKWAPNWLVEAVAAFGFMPHFESIKLGLIDLRDIAYYFSVMAFMLFATHVVLENRKSA